MAQVSPRAKEEQLNLPVKQFKKRVTCEQLLLLASQVCPRVKGEQWILLVRQEKLRVTGE